MQRVSYRAIRERFRHIDADFVSFETHLDAETGRNDATLIVSLYPWWEHPKYLGAIRAKRQWRMEVDSVNKPVIVHARGLREVHFQPQREVIDWDFVEGHQSTWRHGEKVTVVCNSAMSESQRNTLRNAIIVAAGTWFTPESVLTQPTQKDLPAPPFHLGEFPVPLAPLVEQVLRNAGIEYYLPFPARSQPPLVALILDGTDVIVSEDFELEVPDFEHPDEVCIVE